jgi:hypothetical protein
MMRSAAFGAALLLAGLLGSATAAAYEYHPSQIALFDTPHLQNISAPVTLHYGFHAAGKSAFDDQVELIVTDILPNGRRNLAFNFLTGERHRDFEPLKEFRGNPLIMLFLERDVAQMSAETGGSELWFRNRIKESFWAAAMTEVAVPWQGKEVKATQITIKPFLDKEELDVKAELKQKSYDFFVAPDVPGGLYSIRSTVPDPAGAAPLQEDSVTLVSVGD